MVFALALAFLASLLVSAWVSGLAAVTAGARQIAALLLGAKDALVSVVFDVTPFLYFAYSWSRTGNGQTWGMRLFRIRVIGVDGRTLSIGQALFRAVALVFSLSVVLMGVIAIAFDRNKQGWHDRIANTYVIEV